MALEVEEIEHIPENEEPDLEAVIQDIVESSGPSGIAAIAEMLRRVVSESATAPEDPQGSSPTEPLVCKEASPADGLNVCDKVIRHCVNLWHVFLGGRYTIT